MKGKKCFKWKTSGSRIGIFWFVDPTHIFSLISISMFEHDFFPFSFVLRGIPQSSLLCWKKKKWNQNSESQRDGGGGNFSEISSTDDDDDEVLELGKKVKTKNLKQNKTKSIGHDIDTKWNQKKKEYNLLPGSKPWGIKKRSFGF